MPGQLTFSTQADGSFDTHRKPTRRGLFLAEMDKVVRWSELCAVIEPFYPKSGRRPIGLERMLRIRFLQQWYALSDPAVEESLYECAALRHFVGIDLGWESMRDETMVCKFRHLLEITIWPPICLRPSTATCRNTGCVCRKARSWMRRS